MKQNIKKGFVRSEIFLNVENAENAQSTTLSQFADNIALWSCGRNSIMSECKIQKHLNT